MVNEYTNEFDFVEWYRQNYKYLNEHRIPKIRHLIYVEQLVNGVGVQTDYDIFQEYLKTWKKSDRLTYFYNPHLDCIEYCIDNFVAFRKYDYGCII